jgi:AcrR family transcriptional regulator
MPKRVDHDERRREIADALLRVVSRDGFGEVSLRHVAAEAGVTAGMVQHYFPSKAAMTDFAMTAAGERYARRITARVDALGAAPAPAEVLRVLLRGLLPIGADELADARIAFAFREFAAGDADAARRLHDADAELRAHLAALLQATATSGPAPHAAATALMAAAEGLAAMMLSAALPVTEAEEALDALLDATGASALVSVSSKTR